MEFTLSSRKSILALTALLAITAAAYYPGLSGAFMFDDIVHVSKNKLVAITGLAPDQLLQAWNSSPFGFPESRPLSMLTFGLNHVFSGFDPFWFKATNLLIHLLCGMGLFQLTRMMAGLHGRIRGVPLPERHINGWALLTAGIWLLHPLNLSPVLYVVQRMTSLSALFVILGMITYVRARMRLLEGTGGLAALLLAVPAFGVLAFLCKENGALLPGFLFVMEITLFRFKTATAPARRLLQLYFLLGVVIPAVAAVVFLLLNPEWLMGGYAKRPFNLSERLMTEARALWFYLRMILMPDNAALGFYHDDFPISRGLLDPPTTVAAIAGLMALLLAVAWGLKRAPVLAFGILFFLTGHSIESSVIALEPVYEHRNYLPDFGLFFMLAYAMTCVFQKRPQVIGAALAGLVFMAVGGLKTALRAQDWSNEAAMALTEAEHHPDSPRANFRAGQLLVSLINSSKDPEQVYRLARHYLERTVELNSNNADGLFGLIVLNLHAGKPVEQSWLDELKRRLEQAPYDPQNITTSQFSYLVRWHLTDGPKLPPEEILGIFDAVLHNPTLDAYARAGIHAALRLYYHKVLNDLGAALEHGRKAVEAWPQRWYYQDRLIRLLLKMGKYDEAAEQLRRAREADVNRLHAAKARELEQLIQSTMQKKEQASTNPAPAS